MKTIIITLYTICFENTCKITKFVIKYVLDNEVVSEIGMTKNNKICYKMIIPGLPYMRT